MKVIISCEVSGYPLKVAVMNHLIEQGHEVIDVGQKNEVDKVLYPAAAAAAAKAIQDKVADKCILICGTGVGMSIAANKHKGIRAACCSDTFSARLTRLHNDANVLCMGGRVIGAGTAEEIVTVFLNTEFEGGRHQRRVDKIMDLEK